MLRAGRRQKRPPAGVLQAVTPRDIKLHIFHDLQHHSCTKSKTILEDQAVGDGLKLTDAIRVLLKQFFLLVRHGSFELFFVPADQLLQFLVLVGRGNHPP